MSDYWKKKIDELEKSTSKTYWEKKEDELKRIQQKQEESKKAIAVESTRGGSGGKIFDDDDLAPVKEDKKLDFFQRGAFADGYQKGDITRTILGTAGDIKLNVAKGALNVVEGVADHATYGVSSVAKLLGADEFSGKAKEFAKTNLVEKLYAKPTEYFDKNSVLARTSDAILQGVGQVGLMIGIGSLGAGAGLGQKGVTALNSAIMGSSSFGSGMGQAYEAGATDKEAVTYGAIAGASDVITEMIFGGMGKSINAVGFNVGLTSADDMLAKKVSQMFTNQIAKNFAEFGVKASAEGLEEVLAGIAQAAGKKMTYMSEEEFGEILKDENLLEQFVVGMATSGFMQSGVIPGTSQGSLIETSKEGRDFITGYSQNEQAVIKKEVENRIAEKEADGTKLTKKERSAIEAQVEKDMERGYISIDTIEETLGGETYKTYKNTVESEDAIQKEFDTLNKMKQGEMTGEQIDRRTELKEKLEDLKKNSKREQLKSKLGEEVMGLVQGDRLLESYNERSRRTEAFQADLSRYDEKQRAVVQKAAESGILNNTNRTHEFVDMVAKISADKGVLFDFTNNAKLKESGFSMEGKTINGYVSGNSIAVNIQSAKSLNTVVGHEIAHVLEGTALYTELQNAVVQYAKTKGDYQSRYDTLSKLYESVEGANIDAELTADLVGDYLFTDSDFINNLSTNHRNVFQKIYDEVKYLLKVATAGSKEARELERVKKAFENAYRETKNTADSGVKYSIREDIVDVNGKEYNSVVELDKTVSKRVLSEPKKFLSYIEKNLVGLKIPVIDAEGNTEVIEFAGANETVSKNNKRHPVLGELAYTKGDTRKQVIVNAGEVIQESIYDPEYSSTDNEHGWLDRNGWESRKTYVLTQDGMIYEAYLKIAKTQDGRNILYAVNLDVNKGIAVDQGATSEKAAVLAAMPSGDNVAQDGKNVKGQFSISDSTGRQLSQEQAEYFKDSKVRDENGNLKVMYHGTPNGDFTVFKDGTYFTDNKAYADRYQNSGASSISTGKVASNPKTFEVYLDIKKPFDLSDPEARRIYIEEYIKGGNAMGIDPYLPAREYSKIKTIDWMEGEDLRDFLIENGYDYDGLVLDEGADGGYGGEVQSRGNSYVVFSPEQVKRVDNAKPTGNTDIRYSVSEDVQAAEKYFGTTYKINEAGYLLTDGKLLDFSGKHQGAPGGYRTVDHRDITDAFDGEYGDGSYSGGMIQFISAGNIRLSPEIGGINLSVKPTKAQISTLDRYISSFRGEVILDIDNENGVTVVSVEYPARTYSKRIINDINAYFDNGTIPEPPASLGQFRYSLSEDSQGHKLSEEQEAFFKDSVIRDENGKLMPMYHGTMNGGFTVFGGRKDYWYFTNDKKYSYAFEGRKANGQLYPSTKEGIENGHYNPERYTVYLNVTNPFITDDANVVEDALYWDKSLAGKLREKGYDALMLEDMSQVVILNPHQIKNVTNKRPTSDPDIRKSLSAEDQKPKAYGDYNVYGEDVALEAPVQEDVAPVAETQAEPAVDRTTVEDLFPDDTATVQEEYENLLAERDDIRGAMDIFAAVGDTARAEQMMAEYEAVQARIAEIDADEADRLASIQDEDAPPEVDNRPEDVADNVPLTKKLVDDLTRSVRQQLGLSTKRSNEVRELIQRYSNEEFPSKAHLYTEIAERFGTYTESSVDEDLKAVKATLRKFGISVDQSIKSEIADYGQLMRRNFGKIRFSNDGLPVDVAYKEFQEVLPGYFPEDIYVPTDQLMRILEVANMETTMKAEHEIDAQTLEEVTDTIMNGVGEFKQNWNETLANRFGKESFDSLMKSGERYVPPLRFDTAPERVRQTRPAIESVQADPDDIAPVYDTSSGQQSLMPEPEMDAPISPAVAEVLTEEPETQRKKTSFWSLFQENVLDNGMVFENLSLKKKNRELQAKWNFTRYSQSRAQKLIGEGTTGVKSLDSIRQQVEKPGLTKSFYEYLYHKHNSDRMRLADRYQNTENKAVFGDSVTAEMSDVEAERLERTNPSFKRLAQDVYKYNTHLRQMLVDGGIITQELADLWQEMYPHFVPIRRDLSVELTDTGYVDERKIGVNAPIKRATGGSSNILPLFDTMALTTLQTYKAIAKNNFGVELKNALGTTVATEQMDLESAIESVYNIDDLLQAGRNGKNATFTVYENGKKVTFEITDEMYNALKPKSDGMAYTNKLLNTASSLHRGVLTEYNPVFMITNAIKDAQDVLINSQHPMKTYMRFPAALREISKNGNWYQEYMENGGGDNTYFDNDTNTFNAEEKGAQKILGIPPLSWISKANNFIEKVPRMAEYIASRESGRSVEVSMLDAARVTTNFAAGGHLTKFLNRNGATFLNASVQGAVQQARNFREAKMNGLKGWTQLASKFAIAGLPALLLNGLMWDDDDEYEELSDYVKQNYYVVAKFDDGKFVRIPKGRAMAVIQNAFEQVNNMATGDDEADLKTFLELVVSNLAPNNPIENNILAPIIQVKNNETWYGEDLVPTRLQDLPAEEQFDESTDAISRWLGEKLKLSPYKINYLLDQYTGGVGDTILPMLTPEAESGDDTFFGNMIAPLKSKFTTDSVMNNQNVTDFYDLKDELAINANSRNATDEDVLMYKYINSVSSELGELYGNKREYQNTGDSDSAKYTLVRKTQKEIVEMMEEALNVYSDVQIDGDHAVVGDRHFERNKSGQWEKMSDEKVAKYLATSAAGDAPYATDGVNNYRWYQKDGATDGDWRKITDDELKKQNEVTSALGITPEEYWGNKEEYSYAYENPGKYAFAQTVGGYESYMEYSDALNDIKADKDKFGKSISGTRKTKVAEYISSLDIPMVEKYILFKSEYPSTDDYNYEIIDYVNGMSDMSFEEKIEVLRTVGFDVDAEGNIYW